MAKTKPNPNAKRNEDSVKKLAPNTIINRVTKNGKVFRSTNPRTGKDTYFAALDRKPGQDKAEWEKKFGWLRDAASKGELKKTPGSKIQRSGTEQANFRKKEQERINRITDPKKRKEAQDKFNRSDADHKNELQTGGKDDFSNMDMLDNSVNRSSGSQIMNRNKYIPDGASMDVFKGKW